MLISLKVLHNKACLLLVFSTYFNSALFANSDTLLIRENFLSCKASNSFSHSIIVGANYTLPHVNKNKSNIDPLIKMKGEKGYNVGYNFAYYFKNKNSIQLGVNYLVNRINFIQDEFKPFFDGNSTIYFDGYKKATFKYVSIEIPFITTLKLSKSSKINSSLLLGLSLTNNKLSRIYGYSEIVLNNALSSVDNFDYDYNNKIIPNIIFGIELFSQKKQNRFRYNLIFKSALLPSQEIKIENNAQAEIYKVHSKPYLNSLALNVSYSLFDKKNESTKINKDSLVNEYYKNKKTSFKIEPSVLIHNSNNLYEELLHTGYSTAMYYQTNAVLRHKTMEYGAGLFVKNILNSSINDSSSFIPVTRNYSGLGLFIRKKIILQNFNSLNIQYSSLISRLKSNSKSSSGIINNDIFLLQDFKHILSVGISHKISKKMEFGWFLGGSFSPNYFKYGYPGISGSIYLSYY